MEIGVIGLPFWMGYAEGRKIARRAKVVMMQEPPPIWMRERGKFGQSQWFSPEWSDGRKEDYIASEPLVYLQIAPKLRVGVSLVIRDDWQEKAQWRYRMPEYTLCMHLGEMTAFNGGGRKTPGVTYEVLYVLWGGTLRVEEWRIYTRLWMDSDPWRAYNPESNPALTSLMRDRVLRCLDPVRTWLRMGGQQFLRASYDRWPALAIEQHNREQLSLSEGTRKRAEAVIEEYRTDPLLFIAKTRNSHKTAPGHASPWAEPSKLRKPSHEVDWPDAPYSVAQLIPFGVDHFAD